MCLFGSTLAPLWFCPVVFLDFPDDPAVFTREDETMTSVYRIRKEVTVSGIRYLVDYRDSTGRRTKRRFQKACEAEAFKKQIEASTITGLPVPRPVTMTFAAWSEEWVAQKTVLSQAGKKPRPSTLQSWISDLKSLRAFFGDYKLHAITTDVIVQYIEHMRMTPIPGGRRSGGTLPRGKSIRNKVGLLAQILRTAKARRLLPTKPAYDLDWGELLGVEITYHRRHRMIPLTLGQLLHFLDVAKAKYTPKGQHEPTGPYYPLFEVAVWTGLRLGELLELHWGDVDLTSTPAVLSVRRSSYKGKDVPTKSMAGMREILLIDRVVQVLKRSRTQCFGTTVPVGWQEYPLFQTAKGTKLDPDNTRQRHFLPGLKRANLPHTRLHDLRECFATLLASVVHHRILHMVLGHEHLETTLQYYVKAERLRDLLHTTDPTVIAIRQELEQLYQMAHKRYEAAPGR
jgi:integrase